MTCNDAAIRSAFVARPGTSDPLVWTEVYGENCYGLPEDLRGQVVLDIGAHIGCFAAACARRGAGDIAAYEPDEANFAVLQENWKRLGLAGAPHRAAVWRSDDWRGGLGLSPVDPQCTGGRSTALWDGEEEVPWVGLDALLERHHVDLMKVDCEGSEFPILYTSQRLAEVSRIVGESHELPDAAWRPDGLVSGHAATHAGLEGFLRECGFGVDWRSGAGAFRVFTAWREGI